MILQLNLSELLNEINAKGIPLNGILMQLTGNTTAAILLGRIIELWQVNESTPFFMVNSESRNAAKFNNWEKDLNFSYYQYDRAITRIAKKIRLKQSIPTDCFVVTWAAWTIELDESKKSKKKYYHVNEEYLARKIAALLN